MVVGPPQLYNINVLRYFFKNLSSDVPIYIQKVQKVVKGSKKFVAGKGIDCTAGGKEGAERKSFKRKDSDEK